MKQLMYTCLLYILSVSQGLATDKLEITNSWSPEAPPGAQVMAGYMEIKNPSGSNIDITAASSTLFKTVEMHLSKEVNGVAKMLPQKKLGIKAGATLSLKPGSYHLMLIKPVKWLKHGDVITVELTLSNGAQQTLQLPVKKSTSKKARVMKCGEGRCGMGKCGGQ